MASTDASGLELENAAIIKLSERHPPLIHDPFNAATSWILASSPKTLRIDLGLHNPEDLLTIEKSFQSGARILYTNCSEIDSSLLPLIYYKNALASASDSDDSRLVLFAQRRLFCNPAFQMCFSTSLALNSFSPNTLACTTPVSYAPSIENFVDMFQLALFRSMFPEEYAKRAMLTDTVRQCTQKINEIDLMLKNKWEK